MEKNFKVGIIISLVYLLISVVLYTIVLVYNSAPWTIIPRIVTLIINFPGIAVHPALYSSSIFDLIIILAVNLVSYFLAGFLLSTLYLKLPSGKK